jgi:hypothetical protein
MLASLAAYMLSSLCINQGINYCIKRFIENAFKQVKYLTQSNFQTIAFPTLTQ